ncbi:MAG: hypothetical protein JW881_04305 [Spirochaetales bacterium]|nr:hypothetical protein [Spirochaetales bacterium]
MKRKLSICLVIIFLFLVWGLYGEQRKEIYVRSFLIDTVYVHKLGYCVTFHRPSGIGLGVFYVPYRWFSDLNGVGDVIFGKDSSYPYFTIVWINGKFSRIKLYVHENLDHYTWDRLEIPGDLARKRFDIDPENFKIEY